MKEYLAGGVSYSELGEKYGLSRATLHRWVKAGKAGMGPGGEVTVRGRRAVMVTYADVEDVPEDVKELQRELKEARLYNKLLNAMIDIAEEQMGAVIRKKPGARQ